MKNIISMAILSFAMILCGAMPLFAKSKKAVEISSIAELAKAAKESNQRVKMKPGVYQMADYLTPEVIENTPFADKINRKAMILFSGSNNTFDLTDVTLEIDTRLLSAFKVSVNEIQINGSGNEIKGLTINDIGNYPPSGRGARSFVITGDENTVDGVTLNMSGSAPYGYGDLLGKGGGSVVRLNKHSGMLIEGRAITIVNCSIYSKSFGHLFFIQGGRDVLFENCYAEAVMRSTDDMLAEKSGPAYDVDFESAYKNYDGTKKIAAGYVKSLSECGFRNYGTGGPEKHRTGAITMINCKAKNTRIGFAFTRIDGDMKIENCEAQGCEVGYSLTGVSVKSSRGDAQNGPLFNISKSAKPSDVELEVMPAVSNYKIHALAMVSGDNHKIKLTKYRGKSREQELPILIGSGRPSANNCYTPFMEAPASNITIDNQSGMPVVLTTKSKSCIAEGDGKITDRGELNKVSQK